MDQQAPADSGDEGEYDRRAKPWLDLVKDAQSCFEKYQSVCDDICKKYSDLTKHAERSIDREFQMFWANLEVLRPSIYSRPPVPVVIPRFRERNELPTKAAEALERTLISSFETADINTALKLVRDDYVITGRGVVWLRYETEEGERGVIERVAYDHVDRKDFLHEPARKWTEVGWVARRNFIGRKQGVERFGDDFLKCAFKKPESEDGSKYASEKKAEVWEIWSKTENLVVWVSDDLEEVLDIKEPFLELEGFYPCPRPAYGTLQTSTLIPVPDYLYYRDQLDEIDELTAKIAGLSESLRMRGFFAAGETTISDAIERALKEQDNGAVLVPVHGAHMSMGTSIKDSIAWLPVVDVANTIRELVAQRKQLIEDVYQVTGLSDIMRGATNANETLGAQQLKSQYGSIRVREKQAELVRIAQEVTRIAGEIIAENFGPETVSAMSQINLPSDMDVQQQMAVMQQQAIAAGQPFQPPKPPVTIDAVMKLLADQRMRPFILETETDSTIHPDENEEKQRRTEFITAIGGFMAQSMPLVQAMPQAAPLVMESLKFVASGFRAGRALESTIDEFAEQMKQMAASPPPNPEAERAKAEMQMQQQEHQAAMSLRQMEVQIKQLEAQMKALELQKAGYEAQSVDDVDIGPDEPHWSEIEKTVAETEKIYSEIDGRVADVNIKAADAETRRIAATRPQQRGVN